MAADNTNWRRNFCYLRWSDIAARDLVAVIATTRFQDPSEMDLPSTHAPPLWSSRESILQLWCHPNQAKQAVSRHHNCKIDCEVPLHTRAGSVGQRRADEKRAVGVERGAAVGPV